MQPTSNTQRLLAEAAGANSVLDVGGAHGALKTTTPLERGLVFIFAGERTPGCAHQDHHGEQKAS